MTPERSLAFSALSKPPSDLACAVAVRTGIGVDTVSIILDAAGDLQRQRIDQLIRANNAEVERRRAAENERNMTADTLLAVQLEYARLKIELQSVQEAMASTRG